MINDQRIYDLSNTKIEISTAYLFIIILVIIKKKRQNCWSFFYFIIVNGHLIEYSGVIFDCFFTWKEHIYILILSVGECFRVSINSFESGVSFLFRHANTSLIH